MIQITPQMRVLVAIEPVDGRKGIDSLARLCQDKLAEDPFSGCVFVFRSRSGTAFVYSHTMGKDIGYFKNGYREGVSCGGRKEAGQADHWKPMRHSYYWRPAMCRGCGRRRCGGE
jgi:hypothetical protein